MPDKHTQPSPRSPLAVAPESRPPPSKASPDSTPEGAEAAERIESPSFAHPGPGPEAATSETWLQNTSTSDEPIPAPTDEKSPGVLQNHQTNVQDSTPMCVSPITVDGGTKFFLSTPESWGLNQRWNDLVEKLQAVPGGKGVVGLPVKKGPPGGG